MTQEKFYSKVPQDGPWDIIIIGSGASALASGAMLSEAGKRVLLLEQHFQPGGFTHTFTRKNYEWDVGVHYFGKAYKTSPWYLQLAGLTNGAIQFEPYKENIDELYFPDFHVVVPSTYADYENRLAELFPHEKDGIRQYFACIRYMRRKLQTYFGMNLLPKPLTKFTRNTITRKPHDLATHTTEQVMSRYLKDDKLKAVLDAQWGNIGAPRQHCSFMVHAAMVGNYLETGAEYPIGGSGILSRQLGKIIHGNGSAIRVKARVKDIIIRDNQARGVILDSGEEILSDMVISSNGLFNTYFNFLKDQDSCAGVISELKEHRPAYEYLNLFIGFKKSPLDFGLGKRGNTWIHPKWNTVDDDPTWDVSDLNKNPYPNVLFFSSASLRDPDLKNRKHNGFNGQIVSAVKYGSFDKWKGSRWKHRDEDYYQLKDNMSQNLMTLLDSKYPGIKDNVDYMELGTTRTYEHFTASHNGIPYGMAPIPQRYASLNVRPMTPVKNLFLCGQDLVMPGVPAAVGSANLCCSLILRKNAGSEWVKKGKKL